MHITSAPHGRNIMGTVLLLDLGSGTPFMQWPFPSCQGCLMSTQEAGRVGAAVHGGGCLRPCALAVGAAAGRPCTARRLPQPGLDAFSAIVMGVCTCIVGRLSEAGSSGRCSAPGLGSPWENPTPETQPLLPQPTAALWGLCCIGHSECAEYSECLCNICIECHVATMVT